MCVGGVSANFVYVWVFWLSMCVEPLFVSWVLKCLCVFFYEFAFAVFRACVWRCLFFVPDWESVCRCGPSVSVRGWGP